MVTRIFLVGFMGGGKTTVGRLLAERLGWTFIDLDAEIERLEGRSVAEIFASEGEAAFRSMERRSLETVSGPPNRVVSLGGGTYVDARNRELVDSVGVSVYLEASLSVLLERIDDDGSRPLARDRQRLEALFAERVASYRMARVCIDTENLDPIEVAEAVLLALEDQ